MASATGASTTLGLIRVVDRKTSSRRTVLEVDRRPVQVQRHLLLGDKRHAATAREGVAALRDQLVSWGSFVLVLVIGIIASTVYQTPGGNVPPSVRTWSPSIFIRPSVLETLAGMTGVHWASVAMSLPN